MKSCIKWLSRVEQVNILGRMNIASIPFLIVLVALVEAHGIIVA